MPTRIILRESVPSSIQRAPPAEHPVENSTFLFTSTLHHGGTADDDERAAETAAARIGTPRPASNVQRQNVARSGLRFRSSILRKSLEGVNTSTDVVNPSDELLVSAELQQRQELATDARSSPRLIGYMYVFMSSLVLFVSMVQFYNEREKNDLANVFRALEEVPLDNNTATANTTIAEEGDDAGTFAQVYGAQVLTWKLDTALVLSPVGLAIALLVVLAHFDTFLFPDFWKKVFQDGSIYERNLLYFLIVFWLATVYISTSSFSVGEVQANVYFISWIAFISTAMNYNIWRAGADLMTLEEKVATFNRQTSFNWLNTAVFTFVTSVSSVEYYGYRNYLANDTFQDISGRDWLIGIVMTWSSFVACVLALLGNYYATYELEVKLCGGIRLSFDWRQLEGCIALALIGSFAWLVVEYTGVQGVFNGPSNPYFGTWGTLFSSCLTLGTWIRENRRWFISWEVQEKNGENDSQPAEEEPEKAAEP